MQSFYHNSFEGLNSESVEFLNSLLLFLSQYTTVSLNFFSIDKVSNLFILLTTLLTPFSLLSNWSSIVIFNSKKLFYSLLIWIEIMLLIIFSTEDLFIFYLGFEGLSIPVFFLIFLYGAEVTKLRASIYFLVYSFISSTCMAFAIFLLFSQTQALNINCLKDYFSKNLLFYNVTNNYTSSNLIVNWVHTFITLERLNLIWLFLFLGFIIKLPLMPFHMWLPEAHAEAPTSGSIMLTGVILKLGGYGLFKFFIPLFGSYQYFLPLLHTLCIIGIIYICLVCLKTNHIKQIIAYSSIVHMNGVCLGLFTNKLISVTGSIYAMLSHSLISSSLFFLAGILYNRYGSYYIENYSGLFYNMPYFSFYFICLILANIATPLTSGFISELLILIDLSKQNLFIFLIFAANYVLNTAYSIWLLNRILFSDIKITLSSRNWVNYTDLIPLEIKALQLFFILIILFGITPNLVLSII